MREMGLHQPPLRDAASVQAMVDFELCRWSPEERDLASPYLLDTPHFHVREWDYAGFDTPPRELYLPCWTVAYFPQKDYNSVVYCDHGHAHNWGALQQDGWCSMDAVWNSSIKETIWRFRMLDGFEPGDQDRASWLGPVSSLIDEEFQDVNELAISSIKDPSALGQHLERVWTHHTQRAVGEEWEPARYMHEILTTVLSKAPPDVQEEWNERVRAQAPKPPSDR